MYSNNFIGEVYCLKLRAPVTGRMSRSAASSSVRDLRRFDLSSEFNTIVQPQFPGETAHLREVRFVRIAADDHRTDTRQQRDGAQQDFDALTRVQVARVGQDRRLYGATAARSVVLAIKRTPLERYEQAGIGPAEPGSQV